MKSKRWKRRNRHTRPEWVEAYSYCDFHNKMNWRGFNHGWKRELFYTYPCADWLYQKCGLVGHRDLLLKNFLGNYDAANRTTQSFFNAFSRHRRRRRQQ